MGTPGSSLSVERCFTHAIHLRGADIGRARERLPNAYAARVKTILVVDDERNIIELVRLYLEQAGYNVVEARDGVEALEQHDRVDPDAQDGRD